MCTKRQQVPMPDSVCRRVESPRAPLQLALSCKMCLPICSPVAVHQVHRKFPSIFNMPPTRPWTFDCLITINLRQTRASRIDKCPAAYSALHFVSGRGVIAAEAQRKFRLWPSNCKYWCLRQSTVVCDSGPPPVHWQLLQLCGHVSGNCRCGSDPGDSTKFAVGVDGQFAAQTPPGKLVHIGIDSNMVVDSSCPLACCRR